MRCVDGLLTEQRLHRIYPSTSAQAYRNNQASAHVHLYAPRKPGAHSAVDPLEVFRNALFLPVRYLEGAEEEVPEAARSLISYSTLKEERIKERGSCKHKLYKHTKYTLQCTNLPERSTQRCFPPSPFH